MASVANVGRRRDSLILAPRGLANRRAPRRQGREVSEDEKSEDEESEDEELEIRRLGMEVNMLESGLVNRCVTKERSKGKGVEEEEICSVYKRAFCIF